MKTAAGRAKLAASMIQPLRLRRDYTSVGRKTFLVEQLPDGALPIYDKDPNVTAYVVGEEGQNILAITKPRRVIFPLFEISSNPEIPLTQIKERRYDLIERAQDLAKAEIQAEEDLRAVPALEVARSEHHTIGGQRLYEGRLDFDVAIQSAAYARTALHGSREQLADPGGVTNLTAMQGTQIVVRFCLGPAQHRCVPSSTLTAQSKSCPTPTRSGIRLPLSRVSASRDWWVEARPTTKVSILRISKRLRLISPRARSCPAT